MRITPDQCRAARALLDWTQDELAERAEVSRSTVRGFEGRQHALHRATAAAIRRALEAAGVELLDADAAGGEGVRRRRALACAAGEGAGILSPRARPRAAAARGGAASRSR